MELKNYCYTSKYRFNITFYDYNIYFISILQARLTAQHGKKGLVGIAAHLANQAHLFEISHVDKVETRLGLVAQRLSQLAEKSAQVEDADKLNKVAHLMPPILRPNSR